MLFIGKNSHIDHNLQAEHFQLIFAEMGECSSFEVRVIDLPPELTLQCQLRGPVVGDDPITEDMVAYYARGNREWKSRFVGEWKFEGRQYSNKMVVIVGPDNSLPEGNVILYTAYGGPLAPREPEDPSIQDDPELLAESKAFWAVHALEY